MIGANGAGKTTLLRAIAGLEKCTNGKINFNYRDITTQKAFMRARLGISLVLEGRKLFTDLTVEQNLMLGAYLRSNRDEINQSIDQIFATFPVLKERRRQTAKTLSGGEQQMLAIGRALMSKPELLLLDEPSLGLMPILVNDLFDTIKGLKGKLTVLLVEQNARKALGIADRAALLELGKIILQDDAKNLVDNQTVKEAYLGG